MGELLCGGRKLFGVHDPDAKAGEKTSIDNTNVGKRKDVDGKIGSKAISVSASRVKTETLIASLHAIFRVPCYFLIIV